MGFMVALVDCPDEMVSMGGLMAPHRGGEPHRKGVEAIISYCKNIADVPVWLVGTSAGTISVANLGISLRKKVDGLILTSSVTNMSGNKFMSSFKDGIIDFALFMVEVPVFIAAHKGDACKATPAKKSELLKARLENSPNVVVKIYDGGYTPKSGPCDPLSQHGFFGIEKTVINDISDFINSNSPKTVSAIIYK
jgi:hypothetical protein